MRVARDDLEARALGGGEAACARAAHLVGVRVRVRVMVRVRV